MQLKRERDEGRRETGNAVEERVRENERKGERGRKQKQNKT